MITLLGVPPEVGFALLHHYARPRNGGVYSKEHESWRQGTSRNGRKHFIKYAYDNIQDVRWAFPLHEFYPKTAMHNVRLASVGNDMARTVRLLK